MGRRLLGSALLLGGFGIVYGALAFAGLAPAPASLSALGGSRAIERGYAIVAGYYVVVQPYTAVGNGLPPYYLASDPSASGPKVRVLPTLADLKAERVVAIVDTSTGDGTSMAPYVVHTVAGWDLFFWLAIAAAAAALALLLWLGGLVGLLLPTRRLTV